MDHLTVGRYRCIGGSRSSGGEKSRCIHHVKTERRVIPASFTLITRTDDSVCFSVLTDAGCPDGALRCLGIENGLGSLFAWALTSIIFFYFSEPKPLRPLG